MCADGNGGVRLPCWCYCWRTHTWSQSRFISEPSMVHKGNRMPEKSGYPFLIPTPFPLTSIVWVQAHAIAKQRMRQWYCPWYPPFPLLSNTSGQGCWLTEWIVTGGELLMLSLYTHSITTGGPHVQWYFHGWVPSFKGIEKTQKGM